MGQRTMREADLANLLLVIKAMRQGDFVGIKKVSGTRWSARFRLKKRKALDIRGNKPQD